MVAHLLRVSPRQIPAVTIDIKTRHTLTISDVMDSLNLDGEVEVAVIGTNNKTLLIADAICVSEEHPFPIYLEVDLSNNGLKSKIEAYQKVEPDLLYFVTHRQGAAEHMFSNLKWAKVIDINNLGVKCRWN